MVYSNGQDADAPRFNSGSMDREVDTDTVGRVGLLSTEANAGPTIGTSLGADGGIQRLLNALSSLIGNPTTAAFNYILAWTTNIVGSSTDTVKLRIETITNKFKGTTGQSHNHSGIDGQGEKINASNLDNINNYYGVRQLASATGVSGGDEDISTPMTGKVPGGGSSTAGVVTSAPDNRAELKDTDTGDFFEDVSGNKVYGRITESAGVWTITFYIFDGTEQAYSFSSPVDMDIYFVEVFNQSTRPTISPDAGSIGSADATADVVDATATQRGLVSTLAQSWDGVKTFLMAPVLNSLTVGSILYIGVGKAVSEAATKLFWDATNFRLGLGTNAPATNFDNLGDESNRWTSQATAASITALATPTSSIRFTGSTATALHGIASGFNGKKLVLLNIASVDVTIQHQSGSASAADRIVTQTAANVSIKPNGMAVLRYDDSTSRWYVLSSSGAGGGGASFRWYEPSSGGMQREVLASGVELFVATNLETSTVFAQVEVPDSYVPGTQIFAKNGKVFSATTTGDFLIRSVARIFKANIDGTSTPTGHTSTNSAQTIDGTTNEIVEVSDLQLTDASGQINSVAVQPGDMLLVQLQRLPADAADTLDDDLKIFVDSFEPVMTA